MQILDAQAALAFVQTNATYIEAEVDQITYPDIQYPELIPVDFSAPEWIKSVTFFSSDRVGQAQWFNHLGRDVPRADVERSRHESAVEMAAIGYGYTLEEIGQAQMLGITLTADKADAARRAYEEFVDDVALTGDTAKGFSGLIDYPGITAGYVAADGTGASRLWAAKSAALISRDINAVITGISTSTMQIEWADTILMGLDRWNYIASQPFDAHGTMTILQWVMQNNVYTARTGQALKIRVVRGLETAGAAGTQRMVAYRRDPKVLKMHIPMRHRFLEAMRSGPIMYEVPGIFRLGGLDIRRPAAVRYADGF